MNTDAVLNVLRNSVERKGQRSLVEQLRSNVEMAVISGDFPDGMPLPSVRALARAASVAPNTVARAYAELEATGIVRALPRRGSFVVSPREDAAAPAFEEVVGLVDEAVRASKAAGLDSVRFRALVAERARLLDLGERAIAVVGRREAALDERVAVVADAMADLHVRVVGLSFEELRAPDGLTRAAGFDWYLVPMLETREAVSLVGPHAHRIMPMTRTLKHEVRAFVQSRAPETRFGIIAGTDEYIGRMVAALQRLRPLLTPPLAASVDDRRGVERVIREADAIVVGSMARSKFARWRPLAKPNIDFTYIPDEATLRRLRARLEAGRLRSSGSRAGAPSEGERAQHRQPTAAGRKSGRGDRAAPSAKGRETAPFGTASREQRLRVSSR